MYLNDMLFDLRAYAESAYRFEDDNWGCCSKEDCMRANYEYKLLKLLVGYLESAIKKGITSQEVIKKGLRTCLTNKKEVFLKNNHQSIQKGKLSAQLKVQSFKQVEIILKDLIDEYL